MEFEFHDWRRLLDTYTVPHSISNGYGHSDADRTTNTNGYRCAYLDTDSFSNRNRYSDTHSRT
jgi:hypothetical protein